MLAVFLSVMGWEPRPISGRTSLKCTTWPSHIDRSSLHHCHSSLPRTHHPSNLRNSWNSSPGVLWNWELQWRWTWYFPDPAIFKTSKHEKWWFCFFYCIWYVRANSEGHCNLFWAWLKTSACETKSTSNWSAGIHLSGWSHALDIFGDTLTNPCYFRTPSRFYFSEKGWMGEASRCGGTMWHQ